MMPIKSIKKSEMDDLIIKMESIKQEIKEEITTHDLNFNQLFKFKDDCDENSKLFKSENETVKNEDITDFSVQNEQKYNGCKSEGCLYNKELTVLPTEAMLSECKDEKPESAIVPDNLEDLNGEWECKEIFSHCEEGSLIIREEVDIEEHSLPPSEHGILLSTPSREKALFDTETNNSSKEGVGPQETHIALQKDNPKKDYICEECGKIFHFQSNLARHAKLHSGHKPYKCITCGKEFSRHDHFRLHKQIHKDKSLLIKQIQSSSEIHPDNNFEAEEFVCQVCGFGFRVKQRLRDHLKLHKEDRPHICTVCNKAFKQIYNLKQHILSHDGPREFVCQVCNKGFRRKAFLKQHMLVHTKEKRYMCEVCGKRYYKSCHVKEHKEVAHNQDRAETKSKNARSTKLGRTARTCDTCNKVFYHRTSLTRHVLAHLK